MTVTAVQESKDESESVSDCQVPPGTARDCLLSLNVLEESVNSLVYMQILLCTFAMQAQLAKLIFIYFALESQYFTLRFLHMLC